MNSKAIITQAKVTGSEYGRETILTLTLDVRLPTPVALKTINEWAASELDWNTRQQIATAQRKRHDAKHPVKLTKAQKKAQTDAHEQETECGIEACDICYEHQPDENLTCLAHSLPLLECSDCDEESAIFLETEDLSVIREQYERYAEQQKQLNREALTGAQEAALFLLLIKKPVQLSIAPAQQAFADLLQLSAPS